MLMSPYRVSDQTVSDKFAVIVIAAAAAII